MRAVNLTTSPVELDPVNGPGMLAPALESSDGAHERDLEEVTAREHALAAAGVIELTDAAGRHREPPAPPDPPEPPAPEGGRTTGGETS